MEADDFNDCLTPFSGAESRISPVKRLPKIKPSKEETKEECKELLKANPIERDVDHHYKEGYWDMMGYP
jgi:hypothetical protein